MLTTITPNLMVENVKETIDFYKNILNFSIIDSVPNSDGNFDFAILSKDQCTLMLQKKENLIEEYPILETEQIKPSLSLFFLTDDIQKLATLVKKKTSFLKEIHETSYGTKEFAIADNNGYVLTFATKQ